MSQNIVILAGNIGREPSFKATAAGTTCVEFSIATSEKTKDNQYETKWHKIIAYGKTAEGMRDQSGDLTGRYCSIIARNNPRQYTAKNGDIRYTHEVVATSIVVSQRVNKDRSTTRSQGFTGQNFESQTSGIMPGYTPPITDDQIPF